MNLSSYVKRIMCAAAVLLAVVSVCKSAVSEQEIIEFQNLPSGIVTNISTYPVTGRLTGTVDKIYVNGVNVRFDPVGFDYFVPVDLSLGMNEISVNVVDINGNDIVYTQSIEYDPNYSTQDSELIYANVFYVEANMIEQPGVLVIDLQNNAFLGLLRGQWIKGITKDGSEIVFSEGMRYSTASHIYTGRSLPSVISDSDVLIFSNDGQYVYVGSDKIDLQSNTVVDTLPETIEDVGDITSEDTGIVLPRYYIDLVTGEAIRKKYGTKSLSRLGSLVIDPQSQYVLSSSYSGSRGRLNILPVDTARVSESFDADSYAGDIVFSPDGSKAYAGFYGDTRSDRGGILIVDMDSLGLDNTFSLHGPASLAVADDGTVYASAFYTCGRKENYGEPTVRGIVELMPSDNGANFEISRIYFVSLLSTCDEPYYDKQNIFYKPGVTP